MQDIFYIQDRGGTTIEELVDKAWARAEHKCESMGYKLLDVELLPPAAKHGDFLHWKVQYTYEIICEDI